jgi:hypothetical protein
LERKTQSRWELGRYIVTASWGILNLILELGTASSLAIV